MAQEEALNNCVVKSVLAAGAGAVLGVAFGIFMGTMEPAHVPMDGGEVPASGSSAVEVER